jgi:hypothetical protein
MNDNKTKKKDKTYFEKYDLYSDANPDDTIRIKYKTLQDTKNTILKLEKFYKKKKFPHNRISQVANVMTQRLRVINPNDNRYLLSKKYFDFLKQRTKKNEEERMKMKFTL